MLKAHCETCDKTDAFKFREKAEKWHGHHKTNIEQIDDVQFASIKRKKGGPNNPPDGNQYPSTEPKIKNCPFCMEEMPRGMARHLPKCDESI